MLLIVDNTSRMMRKKIRETLFAESIPCAVTNTDKIDMYLPAGVIIVTEAYLLPDVKYMADMHAPSPIVVYDEKTDFYEFVHDVYDKYCRDECEGVNNLRCHFVNGELEYRRKSPRLTKTEKRIFKLLLYKKDWVSAEYLSLYCLKKSKPDPKCISVHVCNLNKSLQKTTGQSIVEHRRFCGYKVTIR